jgi:hypothetical protein
MKLWAGPTDVAPPTMALHCAVLGGVLVRRCPDDLEFAVIPAYVRYTDSMPQWMGGYAKWCFISIRPKYKDDKGIHAHEREHVKQWWITTIVATALIAAAVWFAEGPPEYYGYCVFGLVAFDLLYSTFQRFKLQLEVWAYRAQLKHYPDDRTKLFAGWIANKYGLEGVSPEYAEKLLRE